MTITCNISLGRQQSSEKVNKKKQYNFQKIGSSASQFGVVVKKLT